MATSTNFNFKVGYSLDKASFTQIQNSLKSLQNYIGSGKMSLDKGLQVSEARAEIESAMNSVKSMQAVLENAFNTDLGAVNVAKFNQELKGLDLKQIYSDFKNIGPAGEDAFRNITTNILTSNMQLKQTHSFLREISTTMSNTIQWGIASSIMNKMSGSIQEAYGYVKRLDSSLNDIRIVTGQSSDEMDRFAEKANKAAKALGASTVEYTDAALIYAQQGLSQTEIDTRAEITLKAANVTGQDAAEVSEQLTAVWNGYKVTADEAELYIDRLAAVAASTASNLEELSTGMSKVASSAASLGVGEDQLAAQLATIISATRLAPESVGTALKTIYARMSDIEAGLEDVNLGEYSGAMAEMGINVLDATGSLRDMGEVIEEIGGKWSSFSREQQISLAQTMAGTRQYNNLIALFDNWDKYTETLKVAQNATGTLQNQQDIYMERTSAHLQKLSTAAEGVFDSLLKPEIVNNFVDIVTTVVTKIETLIDSVGGGGNALTLLGSSLLSLFTGKISNGITTFVTNLKNMKYNTMQVKAEFDLLRQAMDAATDEGTKRIISMKQELLKFGPLDAQTDAQGNEFIKTQNAIEAQQKAWEEAKKSAVEYAKAILKVNAPEDLNIDDLKNNSEYVHQIEEQIEVNKKQANSVEELIKVWDRYQDEIKKVQENDALKNATEKYQELKKIYSNDYDDQFEQIFDEILDQSDSFSTEFKLKIQETYTQIQELSKKALFNTSNRSQTIAIRQQYDTLIQQLVQATKDGNADLVQHYQETLNVIAQEAKNASGNLADLAEENQNKFKTFLKNLDFKNAVEGCVRLAQGVGQVAAALNSLSKIEDIWDNNDLSTAQKVEQTFSNIVAIAPVTVQGITAIGGAMKQLAIVQGIATNETSMFTAALDLLKAHPILAIIGGIITAIGVGTTIIDLFTTSAAEARTELTNSIEEYKSAQSELETLESKLTDVEGKLNTLYKITESKLTITDKEDILRLQQEARELSAQIELQKQLIKLKQQDVIENAKAAADKGTYEQYLPDAPLIDDEELSGFIDSYIFSLKHTISEALSKADVELNDRSELGSFTDEYEKLSAELRNSEKGQALYQASLFEKIGEQYKQIANIPKGDISALNAWKKAYIDLLEQFRLVMPEFEKDIKTYETQIKNNSLYDLSNWQTKSKEYLVGMGEYISEWKDTLYALYDSDPVVQEANKEYIDYYESLMESYYEQTKQANDLAINIFDAFINDKDIFDKIKKEFSDGTVSSEELKDLLKGFDNGTQIFDYLEQAAHTAGVSVEFLIGKIADLNLEFEDLEKNSQIGGNMPPTPEDSEAANEAEKVLDQFTKGTATAQDVAAALEPLKVVLGDITDILNQAGSSTNDLNDLTLQDIQILQQYLDSFTQYGYNFNVQIDDLTLKASELQETVLDLQKSLDANDVLNSAINELNENNNLSNLDADSLKDFYEALTTIVAGQEEYNNITEQWNEIAKSGSLAQIEFLQDIIALDNDYAERSIEARKEIQNIQIEQHQQELDDLNAERDELTQFLEEYEIKVEDAPSFADTINEDEIEAKRERLDELNATIEAETDAVNDLRDAFESTDWDWEINLEGIDRIQTIGDSVLSEADKISRACELIGEDFLVAADDARELAYVMPEIMQNATVLADGQIQLSDEVANITLGNQQAILQGDVDTTIAMIEDQITQLEAKKTEAEAELVLANALAEQQVHIDEEKANVLAGIDKELVQYYVDNDHDETESSYLAAQDIIDFYNAMQNAGYLTWDAIFEYCKSANIDMTTNTDQNGMEIKKVWQSIVNGVKAYWKAVEGDTSVDVDTGSAGSGKDTGGFSQKQHGKNLDPLAPQVIQPKSFEQGDWQEKLLGDIAEYDKKIAELKALEAELLAKNKEAQEKIDNSRNGRGGNYKEEDNKKSDKDNKGSAPKETKPKETTPKKEKEEKEEEEEESEVLDALEDTADIYHDINLELKRLSNELSKVEKQQEGLFGKDLLNNLNRQLEILEEQKEAQEEKLKIAKQEAEVMRKSLSAEGVTFDENGYIFNYEEALAAKLKHVNEVIDAYNKLSAEEQEKYKDVVDNAKQEYEDFKDAIDSYDDLISDQIPELEADIEETLNKEIEIKMEKFNMSIEIRLDLKQAERDWINFKKKVINEVKDDNILGNDESLLEELETYIGSPGNSSNSQIAKLKEKVEQIMQEINDIDTLGYSTFYGDNKAQALEDLKKYNDELMDSMMAVEDLSDEIKESYLEVIEQMQEAFDEQIDKYEFVLNTLDSDAKLIGLLYGDDAYEAMNQYYETKAKYNNQEIDFLKKRADYAQSMLQRDDLDEEAKKKWEEEWMDSIEKLNSKVEDAVQNIVDQYKNGVKEVIDGMNQRVTRGYGLDYVKEEWDLVNKNADRYLDSVNRMYELDSLKSKFKDAIDNTDSIKNQQKLNELMDEELGKLLERDKISQYDIDRANKRLEIALKEIELEEARQSKSELRLRRDSQGNYNYEFVADETEMKNATQELLDLQNSLYNFDKEKYIENLNEVYDVYNEFQQKLYDLYNDQTLTAEERQVKEKLLVEQYQSLISGIVKDNDVIRENLSQSTFEALSGLYHKDQKSFKEMSDANAAEWERMTNGFNTDFTTFSSTHQEELNTLMGQTVTQWETGAQSMADSFKDTVNESGVQMGGFKKIVEDALEGLKTKNNEYTAALAKIEQVSGKSFGSLSDDIGDDTKGVIAQTSELIEDNDTLINKYTSMVSKIGEVVKALQELNKWYRQIKKAAEEAAEAAEKMWEKQQELAAEEAEKEVQKEIDDKDAEAPPKTEPPKPTTPTPTNPPKTEPPKPTTPTPTNPQPQDNSKKYKVNDYVRYTGRYYFSSWGSQPSYNYDSADTNSANRVQIYQILDSNDGSHGEYSVRIRPKNPPKYGMWDYGWIKPDQILGYDTGGYTGEWRGNDGKMAMLHQKELVLNKDDTENILSAVDIVRTLDSVLSAISASVNNGLANLITAQSIGDTERIVKQQVQIDATFPNVKDHNEIEIALNNLTNIASQYAFNSQR